MTRKFFKLVNLNELFPGQDSTSDLMSVRKWRVPTELKQKKAMWVQI